MYKRNRPYKKRIQKPSYCYYCKQQMEPDYKNIETIQHAVSERGKIISKMQSGVCQKHQKILTTSVKRARYLAMLPYLVRPT